MNEKIVVSFRVFRVSVSRVFLIRRLRLPCLLGEMSASKASKEMAGHGLNSLGSSPFFPLGQEVPTAGGANGRSIWGQ